MSEKYSEMISYRLQINLRSLLDDVKTKQLQCYNNNNNNNNNNIY